MIGMEQEKQCTKCGVFKPLDEYTNDSQRKSGKRPSCKKCDNERQRKKYAENPEKAGERARKYREENSYEIIERRRKYYNNNREKLIERSRKWRESNPKEWSEMQNKDETNRRATKNQQSLLKALDPEKMAELQRKLEQMNQR